MANQNHSGNSSLRSRSTLLKMLLGVLLIAVLALASCVQQSRGFVLPKGDIAEGKDLFQTMSCTDCHSISDLEWNGPEGGVHIRLGGEVTKIKTYGELVTSVINPSHKLSEDYQRIISDRQGTSPMESYYYNEIMTVEELTNIVAFLQSEYQVVAPDDPYYYNGR